MHRATAIALCLATMLRLARRSFATSAPLLVNGAEAIRLAAESSTRVLDCTWYVGDSHRGRAEFSRERIPRSQFFDIDDIADKSTDLPHMLPSPEEFASKVGALGVSSDSTVLLYSRKGSFSAPRVWWMFRVFGHDKVSVLNGGYEEWKRCGGSVETDPVRPPQPGKFTPSFRPDRVRNLADMEKYVAEGGVQIVDTRPAARFLGQAEEPRAGLAKGAMPRAINLPFTDLVEAEDFSKFKSPEQIRAALSARGVDPKKDTVFTCGSGVSAALVSSCLHLIGEDPGAVYDGSWAEWGSIEHLPKVRGDGASSP